MRSALEVCALHFSGAAILYQLWKGGRKGLLGGRTIGSSTEREAMIRVAGLNAATRMLVVSEGLRTQLDRHPD
jgi:hypothetical protein